MNPIGPALSNLKLDFAFCPPEAGTMAVFSKINGPKNISIIRQPWGGPPDWAWRLIPGTGNVPGNSLYSPRVVGKIQRLPKGSEGIA